MKIHSLPGTKAAGAAAAGLAESKPWWAYAKIERRHRDPTGGGYIVQGPARTLTEAAGWSEGIGLMVRNRLCAVVGIRPHTDISAEKTGAVSVGDDGVVEITAPASSARSLSGCEPMRR